MKKHKWELNGVGKAPFKCVGVYALPPKSLAESNPNAYQAQLNAMPKGYGIGSCSVCSTALTVNYLIHDANGKKFAVGCDCVMKTDDDKMLMSQVKFEKLKRDRELREIKRQDKAKAELDAQRRRNGGKTDWEIRQEQENARKARRSAIIEPIIPMINNIDDGKMGSWRSSVAQEMRNGRMPSGKGFSIVCDILAKLEGRSGSKAYKDEYDRVYDALISIEEQLCEP